MAAAGPALPPLREVITRHGLAARKSLGQHFLLDLNLTDRIVRAAGGLEGKTVIEIGPGPGGLTRSLLQSPARAVVAVEKDARCLAALAELGAVFEGRLRIVEGDALAMRLAELAEAPRRVVANLPYNVATALTLDWMDQLAAAPALVEGFTLMFQKEVAERLTAAPGGKAYGRPSVLVQWLCRTESLFDIDPRAFTPPPKVTSSLVALTPRPQPLAPAPKPALERLTAAAFGQRRKMLRQSLKGVTGDPPGLLQAAGVAETQRPEDLPVEAFCALARALADRDQR